MLIDKKNIPDTFEYFYFLDYPVEIQKALGGSINPERYKDLETPMCDGFSKPNANRREGSKKASLCYLLLDPRITKNLPQRAVKMG